MRLTLFVFALTVAIPDPAYAHGGGLNKEGCHSNRKTGDYHCHRGVSSPASQPHPAIWRSPRGRRQRGPAVRAHLPAAPRRAPPGLHLSGAVMRDTGRTLIETMMG